MKAVIRYLFSHKLKYLTFLISFLVFLFVFFPTKDVVDLISTQVAKLTGNQVFVQLDELKFSAFPLMFGAENLSVETKRLPQIRAESIELRPAPSALITQKPAGSLIAKGLFRGDVQIEIKPGRRTDAGIETQQLVVSAQNLSLSEIHKVAELPILLKGKLNLQTSGSADLTMTEQPDFDIELKVDHFEIPTAMVETAFGPLSVPDLKLSSVELKGRLSAGQFRIEKGLIGKTGDDLFGQVKGGVSLVMQNKNGLRPIVGAYNLEIDLTANKSFQERANLILGFLDAYKTTQGDLGRYQFKVSATSPQSPAQLGAVR